MTPDDLTGVGRAVDRLKSALCCIENHDAEIGAFVDVLPDAAVRQARAVDAGTVSGPLAGVPVAIKELFDVAGGDNSYGSEVRAGAIADTDATVVTRLRAAGAVVTGLTRSHEFGWGITTQHATRGSTRNPWDLNRVPGGSSGGSAAAVAADLVPLAVGSDTGGSIRLPAAFCGVLGLKTTFGRIGRGGGVALAPSFDSPGLLARSIALLETGLAVLAGPDERDPATYGAPPLADAPPVAGLRFSVPDALSPFPAAPTRANALATVVEALSSLGLTEAEATVPDARKMLDVFVPHQMAEAHWVHRDQLRTWPRRSDRYGPDVAGRLAAAAEVDTPTYVDAVVEARAARGGFLAAFEAVDVLVGLVGPVGPSTVDDPDHVEVGGRRVPLRDAMMPSTVPQNLAGLPSLTVPVGLDADGLPIGVQITAAPWAELMLLQIGRALEDAGVIAVGTPERFAAT